MRLEVGYFQPPGAVRLFWMMRQGWDYEQMKKSVRTQDSPEIAMVCNRTSSN
jgi:hypothetical protein